MKIRFDDDEDEDIPRHRKTLPRRVRLQEKLDTLARQPAEKYPKDYESRKCTLVRSGQNEKKFIKRATAKSERRLGKQYGEDAPTNKHRGWTS